MTVNYEIKGMLAKLLATEDIIIEHKKVETACFNVHTRVLTLPMWRASNAVVDLLCAHEVGHSRETPDIDWIQERKIPPQFVNITEDARVEKLMKRKYAGLPKTFYNGYKELQDQDFFCIGDDNVSTYNLADRANLYFKVGSFLSIDFTEEERKIIDQIGSAETFNDALDAAEVLYKYCKQNQQEDTEVDGELPENMNPGSGNNSASDFSDQEDEGEGESDSEENGGNNQLNNRDSSIPNSNESNKDPSQSKNEPSEKTLEPKEPEVKTVQSLEKSIRDLVNNSSFENVYVEIPKDS